MQPTTPCVAVAPLAMCFRLRPCGNHRDPDFSVSARAFLRTLDAPGRTTLHGKPDHASVGVRRAVIAVSAAEVPAKSIPVAANLPAGGGVRCRNRATARGLRPLVCIHNPHRSPQQAGRSTPGASTRAVHPWPFDRLEGVGFKEASKARRSSASVKSTATTATCAGSRSARGAKFSTP